MPEKTRLFFRAMRVSVSVAPDLEPRIKRILEDELRGYTFGPRGGLYALFGPIVHSVDRPKFHQRNRRGGRDVIYSAERMGRYVHPRTPADA